MILRFLLLYLKICFEVKDEFILFLRLQVYNLGELPKLIYSRENEEGHILQRLGTSEGSLIGSEELSVKNTLSFDQSLRS